MYKTLSLVAGRGRCLRSGPLSLRLAPPLLPLLGWTNFLRAQWPVLRATVDAARLLVTSATFCGPSKSQNSRGRGNRRHLLMLRTPGGRGGDAGGGSPPSDGHSQRYLRPNPRNPWLLQGFGRCREGSWDGEIVQDDLGGP
ncbi:hypothetical protein HJG60_009036 [Phyllostomus discolor]|uniref:Uncharacterized protein n=1 Tax=Phyllostomus discolor TaxID=89673 RepID=A0A834DFL0_9CHIR|nr:hypothetical protein HJG60_009036 [Phyllostomus discolor]